MASLCADSGHLVGEPAESVDNPGVTLDEWCDWGH